MTRLRSTALVLTLASLGVGCALVLGLDDVTFHGSGADAASEDTGVVDATTRDVAPLDCTGGCRVCGVGHGFCEDFDDDGGLRSAWTSVTVTQGVAALSDAHAVSAPLSYRMGSDAATHVGLARRLCPQSGVRASFDLYVAEANATDRATAAIIKIPGWEWIRIELGKEVANVVPLNVADYVSISPVPVSAVRIGTWVRVNFEVRIPSPATGCGGGAAMMAAEAGSVTASIEDASATRAMAPVATGEAMLDFGLDSLGPWTVFVDNVVIDEL